MSGYQSKGDYYERRNTEGFYKNQENYEILEAGMVNDAVTREDAAYDMDKALRMGELFLFGVLAKLL